MNKTEEAYAYHLQARIAAGEVEWYLFEGAKLKLADLTYYSPDFMVMLKGGVLEMHECKGHWQDDARVKIKVAAERFPFRFVAVKALPRNKGGGWEYEVFGG